MMIELIRYIEHSYVLPALEDNAIKVEDDSDFQNKIREQRDGSSGEETIREDATAFIYKHFPQWNTSFPLKDPLLRFHSEIKDVKDLDSGKVVELINVGFGEEAQTLVQSEAFRNQKQLLNDGIVAIKITTAYDKVNTVDLVAMRQAIAFIELVAQNELEKIPPASFRKSLLRTLQIPQSLLPVKRKKQLTEHPTSGEDAKGDSPEESLQKESETLKRVYDALMAIPENELEISSIQKDNLSSNPDNPQDTSENKINVLTTPSRETSISLSNATLDNLSSEIKTFLREKAIDTTKASFPQIIYQIKEKWVNTAKELQTYFSPSGAPLYQLGINILTAKPLKTSKLPIVAEMPDFSHAITRPVGIGNLQIVRQELLGYEAGEISHIENIMESELFKRSFERTTVDILHLTEESETIQAEERDLQSTERNELVSEVQKEASKQAVASQGQTSTTDYGKLVENSKTNYARSVVDKAVSSLTQRVKQVREKRLEKRFTEKTEHSFDNTKGNTKIRGVYQWVDKKYKTRVMNYGARLLYDVVLPEPASFWIESLKSAEQAEGFQLVKPIEPNFGPQNLDASNYMYYARVYGVTGNVEPPPQEFVETIAQHDALKVEEKITSFGATVDGMHFGSFTIKVPEGYKAISGFIQKTHPHVLPVPTPYIFFDFFIGEHYFVRFGSGEGQVIWLNKSFIMNGETGDIPVTFRSWERIVQFNYAIGINCKRMDHANEEWQLKTFAAITQGFKRQVAEYEEKLDQRLSAIRAQMLLAKNYTRNTTIERTELKRLFIHLLVSEHLAVVGLPTPIHNAYFFATDPTYIKKWGAIVAFFERAFEWENMLYTFYPYFYGRMEKWKDLLLRQDLDPQFEEFLKAGAARVVIPVRPGFEAAMAHYHETGDVWLGEEIPDMFSDMYVSIIDEIKSRNYVPGEEKCVAEWNVKIPTGLVMLRDDSTLPEWQPSAPCDPLD